MRASQKPTQGKGNRMFDASHIINPKVQENYIDIFGEKKPWWEVRDEKELKDDNGNI